jgi:nicotinamide riboside kinase
LGREYTFNDVEKIARLQIEQEKKYENFQTEDEFVFFDTDLIITKVWLEYKYNVIPEFVSERLSARFIDFYLLAEPDLPWEYDPVREHGDDREYFLDWYEKEIQALGTPYAKISGVGEERLLNALREIEKFKNPETL